MATKEGTGAMEVALWGLWGCCGDDDSRSWALERRVGAVQGVACRGFE